MRHILLFALTTLLSVGWGCASMPPVPSRGGPRWIELETEHFVVRTDQDEASARSMIARFERRLDGLLQLGFDTRGELRFKLRVIVLDDRAAFEDFVGVEYASLFAYHLWKEPLVIMSRATETEAWSSINYQLARFIIAHGMGKMPEWLTEGLACYLESAYEDAEGSFVVGAVPRKQRGWLHRNERLRVDTLLAYEGPPTHRPDVSASAWLLVHYLMSEHSNAFAGFQAALVQGKSPSDAWKEHLAELHPTRLDAELERYIFVGRFTNFSRQIAVTPRTPNLRTMSDADVYTARAELYLSDAEHDEARGRAALENLRLAIRSDPAHVQAAALLVHAQPRVQQRP